MTWTPISSPTRRAAAAPASVAAFTDPTSPRTIAVTRPASTFCQPTNTTFAVLHIASAASIMPTRPRVSTIPSASPISRFSLSATVSPSLYRKSGLRDSAARRNRDRLDHAVTLDETDGVDQIRDDAGVIGDDADAVARLERGRAVDLHGRVFLRQPLDGQ